MLQVNSITNGVVIDHIKAGSGYKIFQLLELDKCGESVALLINVNSCKEGKKDMIKIEQAHDIDYSVLGLLDPNITINEIAGEKIIRKYSVKLPTEVYDFIKCKNPRCITNHQNIGNRFSLLSASAGLYSCHYCDNLYKCGGSQC